MFFHASRRAYEHMRHQGEHVLLSLTDPGRPAIRPDPGAHPTHVAFFDNAGDCPGLPGPTAEVADLCLGAVLLARNMGIPLYAVCEAGIGRSQAVVAAALRITGKNDLTLRARGTHNRALYALMLVEAQKHGIEVQSPPEPLVSMVVRLKYPADRMLLFGLSMLRQRYTNWECLFVHDGPVWTAKDTFEFRFNWSNILRDGRFKLLETPEKRGAWGHPWRQWGIEQSKGELVGLSNDDNYYTPGYLEQMVLALTEPQERPLALCPQLHSYHGWAPMGIRLGEPCGDVGCWIARREVLEAVPFAGVEFTSDTEHIQRMVEHVGRQKVAVLERPLFVKN